ncbi:MAG: response regulator [Candidatus Kariarchaeaceae archaeon]|jgi:two-component system chemotaxis response regulator CheY
MAKVLLVDDSNFMKLVTERLLKKLGHEILYKASNGEEALEYYIKNWWEIDLIFLDVVMPKMDGLQLLRKVLSINSDAKVIMVTAISSSSIVTGAMKLGAVEFVTKPFRLSEFVRAVNKVLGVE